VPAVDMTPDRVSPLQVETQELGDVQQVSMPSKVSQADAEVAPSRPTLLTSPVRGPKKSPPAPENPGSQPGSAPSRTIFGVMADRAEESARVDGLEIESFFAACRAYREFVTAIGIPKFLVSDFDHNFQMVHVFYAADPVGRDTLAKLCAAKGYPELKVSWLLWGMEFFMMVVQKLWEDHPQAGKAAYELTLAKHQNAAQRMITKSFIGQVPSSKAAVGDAKPLLLSEADAPQLHELIEREADRALQIFAPTLREAVAISAAAAKVARSR